MEVLCTGTGRDHDRPAGLARIGKTTRSKPMMHGRDQSDSPVISGEVGEQNRATGGESMEAKGRSQRGKAISSTTRGHKDRERRVAGIGTPTAVRKVNRTYRSRLYSTTWTSILTAMVDFALKRNAAAGVMVSNGGDAYGEGLESNTLQTFNERVHRGAYFGPGGSQHDALDAIWVGIKYTAVNWIVEFGYRSFP